jgi:hypothetical protein
MVAIGQAALVILEIGAETVTAQDAYERPPADGSALRNCASWPPCRNEVAGHQRP